MAGAVRAGNPAAWMRGDSAPARDAESAHRLIAASTVRGHSGLRPPDRTPPAKSLPHGPRHLGKRCGRTGCGARDLSPSVPPSCELRPEEGLGGVALQVHSQRLPRHDPTQDPSGDGGNRYGSLGCPGSGTVRGDRSARAAGLDPARDRPAALQGAGGHHATRSGGPYDCRSRGGPRNDSGHCSVTSERSSVEAAPIHPRRQAEPDMNCPHRTRTLALRR